ncbi:MAG: tetraacyldisaccharide 4'-kinase, partial [Gammaproteobacteria bacterium]
VGPERIKAAELLLNQECCGVILSDDGLQHYALARDIEIAVIDGERQFGNGLCLPAGPLREPKERMDEVDFVVVNGTKVEANQFSMRLKGGSAINMVSGEVEPLPDFAVSRCHAVAGIGNPGRFYKLLNENGIDCMVHTFPDHHPYRPDDIEFDGGAVLMTEKDAVKCTAFARDHHWYVPVEAILEPEFSEQFLNLLREKNG